MNPGKIKQLALGEFAWDKNRRKQKKQKKKLNIKNSLILYPYHL